MSAQNAISSDFAMIGSVRASAEGGDYPPEISRALFAAQRSIASLPKTGTFGEPPPAGAPKGAKSKAYYKFTTGEEAIEACREALHANGLFLTSGEALGFRSEPQGIARYVVACFDLIHAESGLSKRIIREWPVVPTDFRPMDKAAGAALTHLHGYLTRDLLHVPREEEVENRDDTPQPDVRVGVIPPRPPVQAGPPPRPQAAPALSPPQAPAPAQPPPQAAPAPAPTPAAPKPVAPPAAAAAPAPAPAPVAAAPAPTAPTAPKPTKTCGNDPTLNSRVMSGLKDFKDFREKHNVSKEDGKKMLAEWIGDGIVRENGIDTDAMTEDHVKKFVTKFLAWRESKSAPAAATTLA